MRAALKDTSKKKKKPKDTIVQIGEGKLKRPKKNVNALPVAKDSYIIVRQGNKNVLALAINPERNRAVIDSTLGDDEPKHIEYDEHSLLANLGTNPKPGGSAFKVRIEPYVSSMDSKYGPLVFFRTLDDLEKKALKSALRKTYDAMLENHLNVFPLSRMVILPKRGKYAGMYHFKRKAGEVTDKIELHPESFQDSKYNQYLLYHEYGHAVWYKMIPLRYKARWIKLYHTRLALSSILKDRLEPLLDELLQFSGTLGDFYKEQEDDNRLVFREVLSHYKKYHKLDTRSLDILHTEDTEKFASMWPKRAMIVENIKADPSEYGMTKPEEFWAEAFAFHMTGRHLSKDITKLMDKTLTALKGGE